MDFKMSREYFWWKKPEVQKLIRQVPEAGEAGATRPGGQGTLERLG